MTGPAFQPTCARKCSSRSCGWMMPAIRTRAAPDWDLRSPAISRAPMAATSRLATVRWAAFAPACGYPCNPSWGLVARDQRPFAGAVGHPTAGKGNVTAVLPVHAKELHHLAVSGAVIDGELTHVHLQSQGIGDDAAGVVALEPRHIIGPRRRARQHPAYGNQAGGPNDSHRRLHLAGCTLKPILRHEKNGRPCEMELSAGVAALHLTSSRLRGTVR